MNILIITDNEKLLDAFMDMSEKAENYAIVLAITLEDALELQEKTKFHLILNLLSDKG